MTDGRTGYQQYTWTFFRKVGYKKENVLSSSGWETFKVIKRWFLVKEAIQVYHKNAFQHLSMININYFWLHSYFHDKFQLQGKNDDRISNSGTFNSTVIWIINVVDRLLCTHLETFIDRNLHFHNLEIKFRYYCK